MECGLESKKEKGINYGLLTVLLILTLIFLSYSIVIDSLKPWDLCCHLPDSYHHYYNLREVPQIKYFGYHIFLHYIPKWGINILNLVVCFIGIPYYMYLIYIKYYGREKANLSILYMLTVQSGLYALWFMSIHPFIWATLFYLMYIYYEQPVFIFIGSLFHIYYSIVGIAFILYRFHPRMSFIYYPAILIFGYVVKYNKPFGMWFYSTLFFTICPLMFLVFRKPKIKNNLYFFSIYIFFFLIPFDFNHRFTSIFLWFITPFFKKSNRIWIISLLFILFMTSTMYMQGYNLVQNEFNFKIVDEAPNKWKIDQDKAYFYRLFDKIKHFLK